MSVRPYPITALASASALGADDDSAMAALRAGRSALSEHGADMGLPFTTWTGLVPTELAPIPDRFAARDTRQARLLWHLLRDMHEPLAAARARWGAGRIGIALGTTTGGVHATEKAVAGWPDHTPPQDFIVQRHNLHMTGNLAGELAGIEGPALIQSSACSSSSKVFGSARRMLDLGLVDAVLVGGIDSHARFTLLGFHGLGILSSSKCRPLSEDREGINIGEGGALLLLEREGPAKAWLRGVGETSDAHHMTQPHPEGAGLSAAIEDALAQAGLPADAVDLVNAHATGTRLNDATEAKALTRSLPHAPYVAATKGYTGHTLGACGGIELAMCVRALQEGWAPGTHTEGPWAAEASQLNLSTAPVTRDFRVALNVSAAFAGHNAAVLLEAP
jgi:3-oxoacyl-[acyl-carrier-protein] synthase-1